MDLLKQLKEAQAHGLSKEEYFHLLDVEVKLRENKQNLVVSSAGLPGAPGEGSQELVTLLQTVTDKLNNQQQQLFEVQQRLGDLCEQYKNHSEQLKNLQQQQQQQIQQQQQHQPIEHQWQNQLHQQMQQLFQQHQQQMQQQQQIQQQHQQQHQQQLQQMFNQQQQQLQEQQRSAQQQLQQIQQQIQQHHQHYQQQQPPHHLHPQQPQAGAANEIIEQLKNQGQTLDKRMEQMKEEFHEMRTTVLNRLEEEKMFVREELRKAQNELLTRLNKLGENVDLTKEKVDALCGREKRSP